MLWTPNHERRRIGFSKVAQSGKIEFFQPHVRLRFEAVDPFADLVRLGSEVEHLSPGPADLDYCIDDCAGTLVIRREGQVVARIEHVPFLGRRMVAIEKLLGVTRVHTVGTEG